MTTERLSGALTWYTKIAGLGLLAIVALMGLGYWPTMRLATDKAFSSMLAGCGAAWVASCIGAVPLAMVQSGREANPAKAALLSTALRFVGVLAFVVPLVLSGWFQRTVLVAWVVIAYLALLGVDTVYMARMLREKSTASGPEERNSC